jgi:hypothetical protein
MESCTNRLAIGDDRGLVGMLDESGIQEWTSEPGLYVERSLLAFS